MKKHRITVKFVIEVQTGDNGIELENFNAWKDDIKQSVSESLLQGETLVAFGAEKEEIEIKEKGKEE